jgi:Fur family ferric uptake transcriptional regulator
MIDRFTQTLRNSGNSTTQARQVVFNTLSQKAPLTIAQLAQACQTSVDRATVYRTVALFERLGIVNRIWQGFKSHIELSEIFTPHHHHAVCRQCQTSIDIISPELEKLLSAIAKKHQFLPINHVIELNGYCAKCAQS